MTRFVFWWTVLAKGMWDGLRGLPMAAHFRLHECGARLSFYESQIVDIAELSTRKLYEAWRRKTEPLHGQCKAIRYELVQLLVDAQAAEASHVKKGLEYPHSEIPPFAYVAFMVVTAAAEQIFNFTAMKILRIPPFEAFLVALGPSAIVVVAAHVTGAKLKQWRDGDSVFNRSASVLLVAIVTKILAVSSISELRGEYLRYLGTAMSSGTAYALVGLNCVFICGGVIASYLGHDADAELSRICGQKKALLKRIRKVWSKWNKVSAEYDAERAATRQRILSVYDDAKAKIDEYRRGVSTTIKNGMIPSWFNDVIPDTLWRRLDAELECELDSPPASIDEVLDGLGITRPSKQNVNRDNVNTSLDEIVVRRSAISVPQVTNGHNGR